MATKELQLSKERGPKAQKVYQNRPKIGQISAFLRIVNPHLEDTFQ